MAKRSAEEQITRERLERESDNENESDEAEHPLKMASKDVMARRKIAMPRRKNAAFATESAAVSFKLPTDKTSAQSNLSIAARRTESENQNEKFLALNENFKKVIEDTLNQDLACDLSALCQKYLDHTNSIKANTQTFPKFTPQSETDKSPIWSGSKSPDKTQSSSIKDSTTPSFTFTAPSSTTTRTAPDLKSGDSKPVFKFGISNTAEPNGDVEKPGFTFNSFKKLDNNVPSTNASDDDKKNNDDVPKLTQTTLDDSENVKKGFQLDSNSSNTNSPKPTFTFGSVNKAENLNSNDESKQNSNLETKSGFSFGTSIVQTQKPNFSLNGSVNNDSKPKFVFGAQNQPKDDTPGFATSAKSDNLEESRPNFTLGSASVTTKPTFTFATNTERERPSFEDTRNENPFKTALNVKDDKPSHGPEYTTADTENKLASSNQTKVPSFTFGSTTSAPPAFEFGKTKEPPSEGFKFKLPYASDGNTPSPVTQNEITSKPDQLPTETDEAKENQTLVLTANGEENEDVLFAQRAKLMMFNPETKNYDSRGIGELKLLQDRANKSSARLLCRSDGMGNILLNTKVIKSFDYVPLNPENENLVKVPVVEEAGRLTTYIVKFKQKADGRQFIQRVDDLKAQL